MGAKSSADEGSAIVPSGRRGVQSCRAFFFVQLLEGDRNLRGERGVPLEQLQISDERAALRFTLDRAEQRWSHRCATYTLCRRLGDGLRHRALDSLARKREL